jgi:hypothetical protein
VGRCTDFLTEIDTETAREKFTYAELEEQDEDLTKLTSWLGKIHARDTLGPPAEQRRTLLSPAAWPPWRSSPTAFTPPSRLQKRLGHASPESIRIYTRVSDEQVLADYDAALRDRS